MDGARRRGLEAGPSPWLHAFVVTVALGCARPTTAQSTSPVVHAPSATHPPPATHNPPATAARPRLSAVLVRDPRGDRECYRGFPRFFMRDPDRTDNEELERAVWPAVAPPGLVAVVSPTDPQAVRARCIATGPHRDLNLAGWCCRPDPTEVCATAPSGDTGLVVTLCLEGAPFAADRDVAVAAIIENRSEAPIDLNVTTASNTAVFLEVLDAAGHRVPPVPPSVPPSEMEVVTLAPHGGRVFAHSLGVFSPPLPPGDYRVHVHGSVMPSAEIPFQIRSPGRSEP